MADETASTRAWLANLAAIIEELEIKVVPLLWIASRRAWKLKPLWQE